MFEQKRESWKDYISHQYRAAVQALADDHGEVGGSVVLETACHFLARKTLRSITHESHHVHIDRVFKLGVGSIPGNPYYAQRQAFDDVVMPRLEEADRRTGHHARDFAAWVEGELLQFERWAGRNLQPARQ